MSVLTKEGLMEALTLDYEDVELEGIGKVRVRALTAGEYDIYQDKLFKIKGSEVKQDFKELTSSLLCFALCGEDMKSLFTQDEIKNLPAKPIRKLYSIAQKLNGETDEGREEIEGN